MITGSTGGHNLLKWENIHLLGWITKKFMGRI